MKAARLWSATAFTLVAFSRLAAQDPAPGFPVFRLNGSAFIEQIHSDVTTSTGTTQRRRLVIRTAGYSLALRDDTLIVTADSVTLSETADGVTRIIDVDPVIGGRWKLTAGEPASLTTVDQPFVTRDIADVSDVGAAMDDFFPPVPPPIAVGRDTVDAGHWQWHRAADSAGLRRYHRSGQRHGNTTSTMSDSLLIRSIENVFEKGELAWDAARGPVSWTRSIQTDVTSRFAGRTVRAVADQRIEVRRMR